MQHAYNLARSNKGAPGIDGVSFAALEAEEGVEQFLAGLAGEVKNRTYQPMPVRRVMIPKPDGTQRPLGIPTIRDRVMQMAVKLIIEPIFEADFVIVRMASVQSVQPIMPLMMWRMPCTKGVVM